MRAAPSSSRDAGGIVNYAQRIKCIQALFIHAELDFYDGHLVIKESKHRGSIIYEARREAEVKLGRS